MITNYKYERAVQSCDGAAPCCNWAILSSDWAVPNSNWALPRCTWAVVCEQYKAVFQQFPAEFVLHQAVPEQDEAETVECQGLTELGQAVNEHD